LEARAGRRSGGWRGAARRGEATATAAAAAEAGLCFILAHSYAMCDCCCFCFKATLPVIIYAVSYVRNVFCSFSFPFFFFLLFFGFSLINMWQRAPLSARSRSFRTRVRA
jgi:hypothetical protein